MRDLPGRWRILRDSPAAAAWNMALDEALARSRREGEGVLRIYRWARPSLSFGRNQTVKGRYDPEAFAPLGVEAVRRPTGGREVLHDRELTYSVVLPLRGAPDLRGFYRQVNGALVAALRSLDLDARLAAPTERTPSPDAGACFRSPVADEIEVGGRKVVGSAQVRLGRTLLQHGSLLLGPASVELRSLVAPTGDDEPSGLEVPSASARATSTPAASAPDPEVPAQGGVSLAELTGGPVSFPRVAAAVEAAMAGALGGRWARDEIRQEESCAARSLSEGYASAGWTWRR